LIPGFLAGRNQCCTLKYSQEINQDIIDTIVQKLNRLGVDIFHEAGERSIIFRTSRLAPIEYTAESGLPYLKQILLMIGLTARLTVEIKERKKTAGYFENIIGRIGGNIFSEETRTRLIEDPEDPRKKIRVGESDFKRRIVLKQSDLTGDAAIDIPADYHSTLAAVILCILKKAAITMPNIPLTNRLNTFIKYLKSVSVDIEAGNKRHHEDFVLADIKVKGGSIKARKIPDDIAASMMEELPYISVLAALGEGNTIIRGVGEFREWRTSPFAEICEALKKTGIKAGAIDDGLIIEGGKEIENDVFGPFLNRETALAFYAVALSSALPVQFDGFEVIKDNYPEFLDTINDIYERQHLLKMGA